MSAQKVKIALALGRATIEVDGHDIADGVRSFRLSASAGHMPSLSLELVAMNVDVEGEPGLWLSAASVDLLGAFGWKPPVEPAPNGSVTLTLPADDSSGSSSGAAS